MDADNNNKVIKVRIGNMTYHLSSEDDVEMMRDIAKRADIMMQNVKKHKPQLNETATAVLALVNAVKTASEANSYALSAKEKLDNAHIEKEELIAELTRMREQFWELKKNLIYFQNLADSYEQRFNTERKRKRQETSLAGKPQITVSKVHGQDEKFLNYMGGDISRDSAAKLAENAPVDTDANQVPGNSNMDSNEKGMRDHKAKSSKAQPKEQKDERQLNFMDLAELLQKQKDDEKR